jgi:hypothetical protein
MNLRTIAPVALVLATVSMACSAPVSEPEGSTSNKLSAPSPPERDPEAEANGSRGDTLLASLPMGGGMCIVTDGSCVLAAGGAAGATVLAAQSCGTSFVAAVAVLVCQVGLGGPEDPLADFCSGAAASVASSEAVACLANAGVSAAAIDNMRSVCIKSCPTTG